MKGLSSELLKYKRTFMGKLIVFIPVFFAIYSLVVSVQMKNPLAVEAGNTTISATTILALVFNWWPFVFLPLGYALFATLVAIQEKKAGNYRALRSQDVSKVALWVNKVLCMAIYGLFSTVVLMGVTAAICLFTTNEPLPFVKILEGGITCWGVSLALIPIQLFAATFGGTLLSMGIGFVGMLVGVLVAATSFWFICPWSWATRLMSPIIGIHPNGTILAYGDPLLNVSVIPVGIVVSLLAFVSLTLISGIWFSRKEIQ